MLPLRSPQSQRQDELTQTTYFHTFQAVQVDKLMLMWTHHITHTHTLSQSHCCCWRNLLTWPQHHLHFLCYDLVAPAQNRCHGEEAESPWKHQWTAKDTVGLVHLKAKGEIYINKKIHNHTHIIICL